MTQARLPTSTGAARDLAAERKESGRVGSWRRRTADSLSAVYGWRCWYCGGILLKCARPKDHGAWHIDHIIPKSQGGRNGMTNLALACTYCNRAKHAMPVYDFFQWLVKPRRPTERILKLATIPATQIQYEADFVQGLRHAPIRKHKHGGRLNKLQPWNT